MENNNASYLKTDDNKIINEKYIRWIKKMDECFEICTRSIGCNIEEKNTHRVCKIYNRDSYNKLNNLFE
jgi:hypothetical protein